MALEVLEGMSKLLDGIKSEGKLPPSFLEESGFTKSLEAMGVQSSGFAIEEIEGSKMLTNRGRTVNLTNVIRNMENYGNIPEALTELHVTPDVIESEPVTSYAKFYKQHWEAQPGNVDIKTINDITKTGDIVEAETGVGDPDSVGQVERILDVNPRLKSRLTSKLETLEKKVRAAAEKGNVFKAGTWIKRGVFLGAGIITTGIVYSEILKHRDIMNGCWLVDIKTGEKCKISSLTCHDKALDKTDHICGSYNVCGKDGISPCFAENTCVTRNPAGVCTKTIGKCTKGKCNPLCSINSPIRFPSGKRLQCVDVNFWGAAEDFVGSSLTGVFGENFIFISGLIIAIIIIVLILFR